MDDTTTQNHDSPPPTDEPSAEVGDPECYEVDVTISRPLTRERLGVAIVEGEAALRYLGGQNMLPLGVVGTARFSVIDTAVEGFLFEADSIDQEFADLVLPLFADDEHLCSEVAAEVELWAEKVLVVESVTIDESHRGFGLGRMLVEAVVRESANDGLIVVLRAAPILREGERPEGPAWEAACEKLRGYWAELGFSSPFPADRGHMVLGTDSAWGFEAEPTQHDDEEDES